MLWTSFVLALALLGQTKTVYDFKVKDIDNQEVSLSVYRGKVLLIVNTASRCGFTSQYEGLQKLYEENRSKGFEVLGFPSNDFGGQEPGSAEEIKKFCKANFGVTFPLFAKAPVSGKEIQPLYKFLTTETAENFRGSVKWNFTKFLVDRNGQIVDRFSSMTGPQSKSVKTAIQKLLNASPK